jgi:protein gp37
MGNPRYRRGFAITLHADQITLPLRWKRTKRVFVNSMSDLFHEAVPDDYIRRVFDVMVEARWHTFQVLTKRSRRLAALAPRLPWPPNVWQGVSVESANYTSRVTDLQSVPAAIRFLSVEPLLGPSPALPLDGIHWVIVGGESGNGARPFDVGWARALVRECKAAGVACFVKQVGRYPHVEFYDRRPGETGREWERRERPHFLSWPSGTRFGNPLFPDRIDLNGRIALLSSRKGGDMAEWPRDLRVREWPRAVA